MSQTKNTGGPAFPYVIDPAPRPDGRGRDIAIQEGMTLRDYFAGQVMAKTMPNEISPLSYGEHMKNAAQWAYAMADEMLKAREQ